MEPSHTRHAFAQAAYEAFAKRLRKIGITPRRLQAAVAGWEYALEQMSDHENDRYDWRKFPRGEDEARDLVDGNSCSSTEKEVLADYAFDGIVNAREFAKEKWPL